MKEKSGKEIEGFGKLSGWERLELMSEYLKLGEALPSELNNWFCRAMERVNRTSDQTRKLRELGLQKDGRQPAGSERTRADHLTENERVWGLLYGIIQQTEKPEQVVSGGRKRLIYNGRRHSLRSAYQIVKSLWSEAYPDRKPPTRQAFMNWEAARKSADEKAIAALSNQRDSIKTALQQAFDGMPKVLDNCELKFRFIGSNKNATQAAPRLFMKPNTPD